LINKKKTRSRDSQFYKKLIKVTVNFLKFNKLLYLKGKIGILKYKLKKKNILYILL